MNKKILPKIGIYTFLSLWACTTIYPFLWVVINSFKPKDQILNNSFSLPISNFTFDNYLEAMTGKYNLLVAYGNSLIISITVVISVLFISTFSSFALARFDFKGKKIVYGTIVACMMFPIFSIIYPMYGILVDLNIMNTHLGVILPQIAGNLAFTTILLTGFMRELPKEVEESAFMDGANIFQVIFKLVIPMSKSSFVTAAIFIFLWSYNDLFLQMLVIKDIDLMPIGALLREISSKYGTNFGLMASSVSLISVPVIIVYIFLQKHIIKGLTAGAVKG